MCLYSESTHLVMKKRCNQQTSKGHETDIGCGQRTKRQLRGEEDWFDFTQRLVETPPSLTKVVPSAVPLTTTPAV